MPRRPRSIVPGAPLHITQRGVDRCPTFLADDDFAVYRLALREASAAARCAVHAYALMANHVHLLLSPSDATGPSRMMQSIGRMYVRYFNDKYSRTGTLWEGRFRCAYVDSAHYLFSCYRYIELNPVRAAIVTDPAAYEWSSHQHNAHGVHDPIVVPHPLYDALDADRDGRCHAYRMLYATQLTNSVVTAIRAAPRGRARLHPTSYREAVDAVYGLGGEGRAPAGSAGAMTPGP